MDNKKNVAMFCCLFEYCISFSVLLSLVLSRNSQLHTACYKRGGFLYFKYAVYEWFKKKKKLMFLSPVSWRSMHDTQRRDASLDLEKVEQKFACLPSAL